MAFSGRPARPRLKARPTVIATPPPPPIAYIALVYCVLGRVQSDAGLLSNSLYVRYYLVWVRKLLAHELADLRPFWHASKD